MKLKTWIGFALWLVSTFASAATIVLTQSASQVPVVGSPSCNAGGFHAQNSYWRAYDLAALSLASPLSINMVEFGAELADANGTGTTQPVTVNVYTSAGAFPGGALTLRASQLVNLPDQALTVVQVPLTTPTPPLPVNSIVVLELATPNGQAPANNKFFIGSNSGAETRPSYVSAAGCAITTPTNLGSLGYPNVHIILNATGTTTNTLPENLACATNAVSALPPSSLAPVAAKSKTTLLNLLNTASTYQAGRYWSLSLAGVRSAKVLVDGCALRGTPDSTGDADLVTNCPAQAPIYACLRDAETQLTTPPPGK